MLKKAFIISVCLITISGLAILGNNIPKAQCDEAAVLKKLDQIVDTQKFILAEISSIKEELHKSYKSLEEGGSFGKSLKDSKLFPGFMTNLIIVGEESGRLDEALGEVAGSYERDTEEALKVMTSLIEPVMILVMGLIVGFIVIAMLLPVFQINMMAG